MAASASVRQGSPGSCVANAAQTGSVQEAPAHPVGREDGWSVPATGLSPLRQFDATDANGSQGRRQIKRGLVVMNSTAEALTQSEDDGLEASCAGPRAGDSMLSALYSNW